MTQNKSYFYGTGRRKSAVARVRLYPGTGQIVVNGRSPEQHFGARVVYERVVTAPMRVTETLGRWNVMVKVAGGGTTGQASAVAHGIARALCDADTDTFRSPLKKAGLLTRDARVKERKKVGLKRARKAPQYTKR
ncbi:MAG TPA: 30S ribosomal protein S9 [Chloroflexia bacterium]|nr:30S ribosomal protein S9 [Chloroflexia bacterium]